MKQIKSTEITAYINANLGTFEKTLSKYYVFSKDGRFTICFLDKVNHKTRKGHLAVDSRSHSTMEETFAYVKELLAMQGIELLANGCTSQLIDVDQLDRKQFNF